MITARAIPCAIRCGRQEGRIAYRSLAIRETVRGHVISFSFVHCASWHTVLPYNPAALMSKQGDFYRPAVEAQEKTVPQSRQGAEKKA